MRKAFFLPLLMLLVIPAYGQTQQNNPTNLKDLLSSQSLKLTIQLKDLNADWTRLNVGSGDSGMGGYMQMLSSMFGGSSSHYYTKGQTLALAGETFIVAYAPKGKPIDPSAMMRGKPPVPEALTPNSQLTISLINLRTCGNLTDIRPFDIKEETAEPKTIEEPMIDVPQSQSESPTTKSLSNLKVMALGLAMYTQDNNDTIPALGNSGKLKALLNKYIGDDSVFINPITKKAYKANTILSLHKMSQIHFKAPMVVFYEDAPAPDGTRGVAFLDGHAKRISESEWPRVKRASKIP